MTAPGEAVWVYDKNGIRLDELQGVQMVRSWNATGFGKATLKIPARHAKATATNLHIGNRILVQSALVDAWAGVIWTPIQGAGGVYTLQISSIEERLKRLYTGNQDILTGTPGAIFTSLIGIANAQEATGMTVGAVDTTGTSISREFNRAKIGDSINKLATDFGFVWWVTASDVSGVLTLSANWATDRGATFSTPLEEPYNLHIANCELEGNLVNEICVVGKFANWSAPFVETVRDATSSGEYGLSQDTLFARDVTDSATLLAMGVAKLPQVAQPLRKVTAVVTKSPFPKIGDICDTTITGQGGLFNGRFYSKVMELSYDPARKVAAVILKEQ